MAMIALKCESCGASIELVDPQGFATCPYCETRAVLRPELLTPATPAKAAPVLRTADANRGIAAIGSTLVQVSDLERKAAYAQKLEADGRTAKACDVYREMAEQYPKNYQGWFGLARLCEWKMPDSSEYCIKALETSTGDTQ